ncbi:MAG: PAS domain S-box protein, partial [Candidatus Hydrogenedentales bacterium]
RNLQEEGYTCSTFPDGEAAVEAMRKGGFDVALIDLDMPELDGFQVLATIQEAGWNVIPIVLTGLGDVEKAVRAIKLGAFDFLEKPYNPELLSCSVQRAGEYRRAMLDAGASRAIVEQFRTIFDAFEDPLISVNLEGKIVQCNEATARQTKATYAQLLNRDCHEAFCEDSHPREECPLLLAALKSVCAPAKLVLGKAIFEVTSIPLSRREGSIWGRLIYAHDATARLRTQDALRVSEENLRVITDVAQDAIVLMDAEGKIAFYNRAAERTFGWSANEAIGRDLHSLLAPAHYRPLYENGVAEFRQFGTGPVIGKALELTALHKDGHTLPVEVTVSGVKHRERWNAVGIIRDITERRRVEQNLIESEERYRLLFRGSRDAIMILEPPLWRFASCNPASAEMFGFANEAACVLYGPQDISPEYQPEGRLSSEVAKERIEAAMCEGNVFFEWTHKNLEGKVFPASVLLTRVDSGDRMFLLATVRDITLQKEAQNAIEKAHAELEQRVEDRTIELALANTWLQTEVTKRESAESELRQLNRSLRLLSECNQLVVRMADENQFLSEVSRVLVEFGGFPMVWIALDDPSDETRMLVIAQNGFETALPPYVRKGSRTSGENSGLPCETIRVDILRAQIAGKRADYSEPWEREAMRRGNTVRITFPLCVVGETVGIATVYTAEPGVRSTAERDMLKELASDLGFAVASLRAR